MAFNLDSGVFWRLANANIENNRALGQQIQNIADSYTQAKKEEKLQQDELAREMLKEQIKQERDTDYQYLMGVKAIQQGNATPEQIDFVKAVDATKTTALAFDPNSGNTYQRNKSIFDVIGANSNNSNTMQASQPFVSAAPKPVRSQKLPMPPAPNEMQPMTEDLGNIDIPPVPSQELYDQLATPQYSPTVVGTVNPDGSLVGEPPMQQNAFNAIADVGVNYPTPTNPKEASVIFQEKAAAAGKADAEMAVKNAEALLNKGKELKKDTENAGDLNIVLGSVQKAKDLIDYGNTGRGAAFKILPETEARTLAGYLDQIKSNVAFDKLRQIKEQSATGSALGAVSNFELNLLEKSAGSLDQFQEPKILKENLTIIENRFNKAMENIANAVKRDIEKGVEIPPAAMQIFQEYEAKKAQKSSQNKSAQNNLTANNVGEWITAPNGLRFREVKRP